MKGWILPVSDSPKAPSERITMSMPVVNAAKEVVFVALGEGKAEIVQRVLEVRCTAPCVCVSIPWFRITI